MGARMTDDVVVIGVGARIATGLDALTAAMSIRARKSFVRETRFIDRAGEPIALATVASIGEDLVGRDRYVALGAPPMAEALRSFRGRWEERGQTAPPVPVLLALPAEADPLDPRGTKLVAALAERAGVAIDAARSRTFAQGRAAGAAAIEAAVVRLRSGEDEAVLVGGIDSWFDPDRLEALDAQRRLHGAATENGFIPGEGAAFVLLASRRRAGRGFFASVAGVATEREPRPYGSREPCHALGITLSMKRAIEGLGAAKIGWALTDVVGERHRLDEWLFASGRIQGAITGDLRHDQPLMVAGDLGAASVPLLVVLACVGWQVGCAPADLALVAACSDGPERGALLLASASLGRGGEAA
jgi:3-oxoacyl-[acyl-carrier-protein] synthase-1